MTRKRSLRQVLARQWVAFGLVVFCGFAAMGVLLLFVLEDSFIDQRLREVAQEIATRERVRLPVDFERHAIAAAPPELRARMRGLRVGGIREFRLGDGRYVHALLERGAGGETFVLAYDVSHRMRVNPALARAWPWLALVAAAMAACASWLASRFVRTVAGRAHGLVRSATSDPPGDLRALARDEPIEEFSALARVAAQAWESRRAALERERDTLAFLGHELRTPLQSARNSLALLEDDRGNAVAWARLQRAQQRLARASHSVLWLMSAAGADAVPAVPVAPIAEALVREFAPLAAQRAQRLQVRAEATAAWPMPAEVIETVLANLLLNAIQHGGPGAVRLAIGHAHGALHNPAATEAAAPGFGIGLVLVERLLQRFGWALQRAAPDNGVSFAPIARAPETPAGANGGGPAPHR